MKVSYLLLALALAGCSSRTDNTIKFPERAYQYGVYRTVQVHYDVDSDGRVENVVVDNADDGFFTRQIVADMKHWRLATGDPKNDVLLTVSFERGKSRVNFRED